METNEKNPGNGNQNNEADKKEPISKPQNDQTEDKKSDPVYIKDMPPIDGARPGVV